MARALYSGGDSWYLGDRYFEETHNYQHRFRHHLFAESGLKGRVLDIGCRDDIPGPLAGLEKLCGSIDGVDPDAGVMQNPHLRNRWHGFFEDAAIPSEAYDLAYAYNVIEHIAQARPFFENVARVLKPGGVFWALTPHKRHLFPFISRNVERLGLKGFFHRRDPGVNPYPAYYRLNSRQQIFRAIEKLPFEEISFHYYPAGWGQYFPRGLRFVPRVYDALWGYRKPGRMLIMAFRIQKKA